MEHTLREVVPSKNNPGKFCLNPCCNGTYSPRQKQDVVHSVLLVLILVVMEHTLRVCYARYESGKNRLNPCCNGTYSPR